MAQLRVFVSHSSSDKAFADALVSALRQAGADVWYDEHNLGAGQLLDDIQRELAARPAFIVVLSKAAFASAWAQRECNWAFNLYSREPERIVLPVVAQPIEPADFNAMLYLEDFKRIEGPGHQPYPQAEAIERTLRLLALTPTGQAPTPTTRQPSESVEDLIAHGKALNAQKRYDEALPFFERATQLAPHNFDAWFNLGNAHGDMGRYGEALAAYDRALALDPNFAVAWTGKGNALWGLKRYRYEEALAAYDQALAPDPNLAVAWCNKGSALYGRWRYEEALVAYDRALALDPNYRDAWNGKGVALYSLKRYEEALVAVERALALDPNNAYAWNGKAISLRKLGRKAEARVAKRRAKALGG
jgi:tetratricopeptide (TPR) repeat protein